MNETCPFCDSSHARAELVASYEFWNLFLQSDEKRAATKQSAGFLASKRHFAEPVSATNEEWSELRIIIKPASEKLCEAAGVSYTQQETVGFNQGVEAGQSVSHAHVHILPVASEDPNELRTRSGIGGAFESLRRERLGK